MWYGWYGHFFWLTLWQSHFVISLYVTANHLMSTAKWVLRSCWTPTSFWSPVKHWPLTNWPFLVSNMVINCVTRSRSISFEKDKYQSINLSINQMSKAPISPAQYRVGSATLLNSKIHKAVPNGRSGCILRRFLKVAIEVAEWNGTDVARIQWM